MKMRIGKPENEEFGAKSAGVVKPRKKAQGASRGELGTLSWERWSIGVLE